MNRRSHTRTDTRTDILTSRKNQPRGPILWKLPILCWPLIQRYWGLVAAIYNNCQYHADHWHGDIEVWWQHCHYRFTGSGLEGRWPQQYMVLYTVQCFVVYGIVLFIYFKQSFAINRIVVFTAAYSVIYWLWSVFHYKLFRSIYSTLQCLEMCSVFNF